MNNLEKELSEKLQLAMHIDSPEEAKHYYDLYFTHTEFLDKYVGSHDEKLKAKINLEYAQYWIRRIK